jgi:hypothetical protein
MLFVLAMEALNHLLHKVDRHHLLTPLDASVDDRVSLYADDLVLFVAPFEHDLLVIRAVLTVFGLSSGLFSNLDKSVATPMHCSEQDLALVREVLSCWIENFPCRYLGVPLSIRKLKRSDEQPLIDKIAARIPKWKGNLLNAAGRSALVKATLSAVPTHMSIALGLSPWAIDSIDKLRRAFIWCGSQTVAGGKCKVAWETVCRPRELGGLGVSDLRRAGVALRVRWEWQVRTEDQLLLCTSKHAVVAIFHAATVLSLGDGKSTYFWTDRWLHGTAIRDVAPALVAAVSSRKKNATVAEALHEGAWVRHITGTLSWAVLMEFVTDATRRHRRMEPCSSAPQRRLVLSSFGRPRRHHA